MSDESYTSSILSSWFFTLFIAAKLAGPCAAWSWWWVFMPVVPVLAEIIKYLVR
jgi:hypothetical protein